MSAHPLVVRRLADRRGPAGLSAVAHRIRRIGTLGAILIVAASCTVLPTDPQGPSISLEEANDLAREAAIRINQHRASLGCGTLEWHGRTAVVGEQYARQMSEQAFFGHVDPTGGTLKSRLTRAGVGGYRIAAETIAAGQKTADRVVTAWIESPGHKAILEDCQYSYVGIGFHTGPGPYRAYWTAVFLATR